MRLSALLALTLCLGCSSSDPVAAGCPAELLAPDGLFFLQAIVIDDRIYELEKAARSFSNTLIFPGGCLPCPREFRAQARAAGLEVVDEYAFGPDYAETLRRWRDAFLTERDRVMAAGFDHRFMLIWEFYLAYCEAAFEPCNTDVVQFTLRKR